MEKIKIVKKLILLAGLLLLAGCATITQINQLHNSYLRKMPHMNRIDIGRPLPIGSFMASANCSYSLSTPNIMFGTDSSFESRQSMFGDQTTVITSSNVYCYETRLMVSADACYAFSDIMASGLSLDASLGSIQSNTKFKNLNDDNVEGSLYIRFAKKYGRIGVALRPEFILAQLYGDKNSFQSTNGHVDSISSTEKISNYCPAICCNSVLRCDVMDFLTPFIGFNIKSQPYLTASENINNEISYGIYCGIELYSKSLSVAPYVTIPFGSTTSHFSSPVSLGVQVSVVLNDE
jgi:hypothetical protein